MVPIRIILDKKMNYLIVFSFFAVLFFCSAIESSLSDQAAMSNDPNLIPVSSTSQPPMTSMDPSTPSSMPPSSTSSSENGSTMSTSSSTTTTTMTSGCEQLLIPNIFLCLLFSNFVLLL
uniref:Uncharacterized protein n=1 Tax=Panagrolaimus sp. JU765 TaxID=591449 RepID=A0AC34PYX4_9BILA